MILTVKIGGQKMWIVRTIGQKYGIVAQMVEQLIGEMLNYYNECAIKVDY